MWLTQPTQVALDLVLRHLEILRAGQKLVEQPSSKFEAPNETNGESSGCRLGVQKLNGMVKGKRKGKRRGQALAERDPILTFYLIISPHTLFRVRRELKERASAGLCGWLRSFLPRAPESGECGINNHKTRQFHHCYGLVCLNNSATVTTFVYLVLLRSMRIDFLEESP